MEQITKNVYVEIGFAGSNNTFVTTSEGIVMIDTPQSPADAMAWRREIDRHGQVKYIINTEPHGDHVSGNFFFEGTVIGHDGVRDAVLAMSAGQAKQQAKEAGTPLPDDFCYRPPAITFSKELTLHVGNHTFKMVNMPGHSPYQAAVYIPEERVVCTSDNIVYHVQPFLHQSLPYEWLKSLERYKEFEADFLVPGHGKVCTPDFIPEMQKIIQSWIDVVKEAVSRGVTLEQAKEDTALFAKHGIKLGNDPMSKMGFGISLARLFEVLG